MCRSGCFAILLLAACAACGGPAPTPPRPLGSGPRAAPPRATCGGFSPQAFLERHAKAYGTPAAVEATLPLVMDGAIEVEGKAGDRQLVLAKDRFRVTGAIGPSAFAAGVDAEGPWSIGSASGVFERLLDDEALGVRIDPWFFRRGYVAFDPARDKATCQDDKVTVSYQRPEIGDPVMVFDVDSASLLSFEHRQADGRKTLVTIASWTEADKGVRWPRKWTEHPVTGSATVSTLAKITSGLTCSSWATAALAPPTLEGDACLAPPPERLRVPMIHLFGQLLVRASIGTRPVWALLDSGAGITCVDATTPSGEAFKPALEVHGSGSTQKIKLGIGALPDIALGDLHAVEVPTASVPIPALASFGNKRPELILGYSFFAAAAVRVDFKKGEVVLAKSAAGLASPNARKLAARHVDGKLLVDGEIEGHAAVFQLDTGNSGGLDLVKRWASKHGIPGEKKTLVVRGRFGAGEAETESTYFRLGHASLGPIKADRTVAQISDPPDTGHVAGLAGNAMLARCDAVVFDHAGRTVHLEGACDKPVPEQRIGWGVDPKPDPSVKDRPWLVVMVAPGGAAAAAGVEKGDRLLEVDGVPANDDVNVFSRLDTKPDGAKIPLVVSRNGVKKTLTLVLQPLMPREG